MKNIFRLSLVVMSAISLSSANSICMEKEITHFSAQSDYKKLLLTIQEQLVIKEIKTCGIKDVEARLYRGIQSQKFCQLADEHKNASVLTIKRRCFQPKIKNDLLAQSVFNVFALQDEACFQQENAMRRKSNTLKTDKRDLQKIETLSHLIEYYSPLPKKSLSDQIHYYYIKNQPAVLVVAKFTDAEEIQKIIAAHKSTDDTYKCPLLQNVNPMQICALLAFFLNLLFLANSAQ